jgi:predicted site-specific integrase-resolvase
MTNRIYKITEASEYLGVSINTLKTLANAEDIMKILTCYSARYYDARGGRKKKIKVENEPAESNEI